MVCFEDVDAWALRARSPKWLLGKFTKDVVFEQWMPVFVSSTNHMKALERVVRVNCKWYYPNVGGPQYRPCKYTIIPQESTPNFGKP